MKSSLLIIGSPGRLRDGLQTILHAIAHEFEIYTANNLETGYKLAASKFPSLIIVDGSKFLDSDCHLLKQLRSRTEPGKCLVIVDTMERAAQAKQAGADAVLLQGFTTDTLRNTLISLDMLPQAAKSNQLTAAARQNATAVPHLLER